MMICTMCGRPCNVYAVNGETPLSCCCGVRVKFEDAQTNESFRRDEAPASKGQIVLCEDHPELYEAVLNACMVSAGHKDDAEKIRMDLLPFEALEEVAKVLTFGDKKYGANTWQHVEFAEERYTAALLRHLSAHMKGERIDPESGLSHLSHMATNALFLVWFEAQTIKGNDTLIEQMQSQLNKLSGNK